jgi:mevalonate kinase
VVVLVGGGAPGGEMNQALYAYMNNKRKMKIKKKKKKIELVFERNTSCIDNFQMYKGSFFSK